MSSGFVPTLVQISGDGRETADLHYTCDPVTGLLHAAADTTPAIERILREERAAAQLSPIVTASDRGEPAPGAAGRGSAAPLEHLVSDVLKRTPDPDVIRASRTRLAPLGTDVWKVAPDPDVVRAARTRDVPARPERE